MKFAHFADVHIGAWRDPKLSETSTSAFLRGLEICRDEKVDFILVSGDFFNTSLPAIDHLKEVVSALKSLKDSGVPVYIIAGSHDFSPTGKTMLDVLENAGLFVNVMRGEVIDNKLKLKFTLDKKTGAKITGITGKKGLLERSYYDSLLKENLESEPGFKVFMFHTALTEFKPKELEKMDSNPLSLLPKDFDYYAGGHVHYVFSKQEQNYGLISYPGPVFPNSFRELEKLKKGGFCIVEANGNVKMRHVPLELHPVVSFSFDCSHKQPESVEEEALKAVKASGMRDSIVTLRFEGKLKSGRPSDIDFSSIITACYAKGAYFVMKNSAFLSSEEFEEIKTEALTVEEIEKEVAKEHAGQIKSGLSPEKEAALTLSLLEALNIEKEEGETSSVFEKRVRENVSKLLGVELS